MNNQIFFFFYNFAHQSVAFDKIVIFFAVYFPIMVIVLAGIFLLVDHEVVKSKNPFAAFMQKKNEITLGFITGIVAYLVSYGFKLLFALPRPFDVFATVHPLFSETGHGFPSGHATFFMALGVSIFLFHKKAGYVFIFFAVLIGLARIIAGVHFPVDILGGFVLGALVAYFLKNVIRS